MPFLSYSFVSVVSLSNVCCVMYVVCVVKSSKSRKKLELKCEAIATNDPSVNLKLAANKQLQEEQACTATVPNTST